MAWLAKPSSVSPRGVCCVVLCCRYDLVEDLTSYLYNNNLLKYIEGYVQKVSPQKTPMVSWGPTAGWPWTP